MEVVCALLRGVCVEKLTDGLADGFGGSARGLTQQVLELGEHLLDRIEIWGVFGQEERLGAGATDGLAHGFALVTTQIVHDDDVAGLERRDEGVLDVALEAGAVDRAVEQPRGVDAIMAQRGQERHGLPSAPRHLGLEPVAPRRPSPERRHVGLGPRLVDEDQALRIDALAILDPLRPSSPDVEAILFAGQHGFF